MTNQDNTPKPDNTVEALKARNARIRAILDIQVKMADLRETAKALDLDITGDLDKALEAAISGK